MSTIFNFSVNEAPTQVAGKPSVLEVSEAEIWKTRTDGAETTLIANTECSTNEKQLTGKARPVITDDRPSLP